MIGGMVGWIAGASTALLMAIVVILINRWIRQVLSIRIPFC